MMLLFRELKIMLRSPAGAIQSLMFEVLVIALCPWGITPGEAGAAAGGKQQAAAGGGRKGGGA